MLRHPKARWGHRWSQWANRWLHCAHCYLGYLLALTSGLHGARRFLLRRKVRCSSDTTTGAVLLGLSARLVNEHA